MNTLASSIPDFAWPIISMLLGYALGSMFFTFLVLHDWLKEWTNAGGPLKKSLGYVLIVCFALFAISALSFIPGLVFSSCSSSRSVLGSALLGLGAFSTIFALYMTPNSHFTKAKFKMYQRANEDINNDS